MRAREPKDASHTMRVAIIAAVVARVAANEVAVLSAGGLEEVPTRGAALGGVALQLRELEDMRSRGTLNDQTFAHAVHETTVLGPLTSSLSALGVLHDKGQLSDDELAFAKSVAFSRYDRSSDGRLSLPPSTGNPSPTPAATGRRGRVAFEMPPSSVGRPSPLERGAEPSRGRRTVARRSERGAEPVAALRRRGTVAARNRSSRRRRRPSP